MKLKEIIKSVIAIEILNDPNELLPDDYDLIQNGVLDSFGVVKVVLKLEEALKTQIDAEFISKANFSNVIQIEKLLYRLLNRNNN